ncbi:MAG: PilZ domain-containing protein [Myxococcota bacterium]
MSAVPRLSMLSESGLVELASTKGVRQADRIFDLSEGGLGVLSQDPLPAGSLSLATLWLPHEAKPLDVIVRVAWREERSMGLQFILPDDALLEAIRRLRRALAG